jgi:hypothetical protein
MIYTVVWSEAADNALADLYHNAADKQELTDASNWFDRILRNDPARLATPFGDYWALAREPLEVLFEIDDGDRMVRVFLVRRMN